MSRLMTKPTKRLCTQRKISLGIHPVWSESSLSTWRKLGSLATHWADSEDSNQTGWMPRLIWVFAGHTVILLVLSWGGSSHYFPKMFVWIHISSYYLHASLKKTLREWFRSTYFKFKDVFSACCCMNLKPVLNTFHEKYEKSSNNYVYVYILNAFTEKPYSKLMRHNVIYNPITTPSRGTSHDG